MQSLSRLLITLFIALLSYEAFSLEAYNARVGHHNGTTRFVIELSDVSAFNSFVLKGPDRAVIDLPHLHWKGQNNTKLKGMITSFRQGSFNADTMRFVLDLTGPAKIAKAFMLKANGTKHARFVLDLVPLAQNEALKAANRQIGTPPPNHTKIIQAFLNNPSFKPPQNKEKKRPVIKQPTAPKAPIKKRTKAKKTIIIDPGHGGIDPGAIGKNGLYEKHVTLSTAKLLKNELERRNFKVVMTRNRDVFVRLRDRINIARKADGDLFISLHADSAKNPKATGLSIYTLSNTASDKESAQLASRENKADIIAGIDLTDEPDQVASILINLTQRDTMNQSKQFANLFVRTLKPRFHLRKTPHKSAGFRVLKGPDIPAVLIELGFLSNRREAKLLKNTSHKKKIAKELAKTIQDYFTWQKNYATL